MRANINLYHGDCMEAMRGMPDKAYDLAIVDPPYGINAEQGTNRASRKQFKDKKYGWDFSPPNRGYFEELFRVSSNQIIWGANHFIEVLPRSNSKHWLIWDKKNPGRCFADCELAWASNMDSARIINLKRVQELNKEENGKIHPTQKPVALYKWQLKNYAKPGDKILDTHGGSMSIAIACWDMGFDLDLWEIDEDYYKAGVERFERHKSQAQLFEPERPELKQLTIE